MQVNDWDSDENQVKFDIGSVSPEALQLPPQARGHGWGPRPWAESRFPPILAKRADNRVCIEELRSHRNLMLYKARVEDPTFTRS